MKELIIENSITTIFEVTDEDIDNAIELIIENHIIPIAYFCPIVLSAKRKLNHVSSVGIEKLFFKNNISSINLPEDAIIVT